MSLHFCTCITFTCTLYLLHCVLSIVVYGGLLLLQDEMELAVKELDEYKELFNERNKVSNY